MLLQVFAYLPTIILMLLLTATVIISGPKDKVNRLFAYISASIIVWLCLLFVADTTNSHEIALTSVRLAILTTNFIAVSLLLFSIHFPFPTKKFSSAKHAVLLHIPALFFSIVSFSPSMVGGVEFINNSAQPRDVGLLFSAQYIYFIGYAIAAFGILFWKKRKAVGFNQAQISLILYSGIIAVTMNLLANYIFVLVDATKFALLLNGPSIVIFAGCVSFAIVRHRMFDIRFVIARLLGYFLSVTFLSVVFGAVMILLANMLIFGADAVPLRQQALYAVMVVVVAFTFPPIKRFFDKATNRIFYQDAYDPQVLINELNQVAVSTIDLNRMLKLSAEVIEKHIKPEFCVFGIQETEYSSPRNVGTGKHKLNQKDVDYFSTSISNGKSKVFISEYLDSSSKDLQKYMIKKDIAVITRLSTDIDKEGVGYIILGSKKSGNLYNSQDTRVLEIIANSMVIAIDNALRFEEIQKFNITLQEKIEEATREMRRTNEKLKALDATKDEFISMASHQLRTPLTSVKGYLSMVLEGDTGKLTEQQEKLLKQAFFSSQRMVYLISDLLNVSRLRTGKFVIESEPTDLPAIIQGEIDQLRETAEARGLKLLFDQPKTFPTLNLDETKIRQVIMNFLDNAIYYSPNGGDIRITLEETPRTIDFKVTDSGIGVPKSQQHQLFGKFYRADNAKRARPDGTGLGLFMAKKVVIAQGGAIIFRSTEGKGSTFGFTFPKSAVKAAEK